MSTTLLQRIERRTARPWPHKEQSRHHDQHDACRSSRWSTPDLWIFWCLRGRIAFEKVLEHIFFISSFFVRWHQKNVARLLFFVPLPGEQRLKTRSLSRGLWTTAERTWREQDRHRFCSRTWVGGSRGSPSSKCEKKEKSELDIFFSTSQFLFSIFREMPLPPSSSGRAIANGVKLAWDLWMPEGACARCCARVEEAISFLL